MAGQIAYQDGLPAKRPVTEVKLCHICIQPILIYGSETRALTRTVGDNSVAFDNICLRRIPQNPYMDHVISIITYQHCC